MKKAGLLILCLVFLLSLCGCRGKKTAVGVTAAGLSYEAVVQDGESTYRIAACIEADGASRFTVIQPEQLKDFSFAFLNDSTVESYRKNLKFTPDLAAIPYGGALRRLYEIHRYFRENGYSVFCENRVYTASGYAGKVPFVLTVSPAGLPISARFDDGMTVEFSGVRLTGESET